MKRKNHGKLSTVVVSQGNIYLIYIHIHINKYSNSNKGVNNLEICEQ